MYVGLKITYIFFHKQIKRVLIKKIEIIAV